MGKRQKFLSETNRCGGTWSSTSLRDTSRKRSGYLSQVAPFPADSPKRPDGKYTLWSGQVPTWFTDWKLKSVQMRIVLVWIQH